MALYLGDKLIAGGGSGSDNEKYARRDVANELSGTNTFKAATTFNDNVTIATAKTLQATDTLSAYNGTLTAANLVVNSTTNLKGATTAMAGLSVTGTTALNGTTTAANLTVNGTTNLNGTTATSLAVNGATTLNGNATVASGKKLSATDTKTELADTDTLIMSDSTKSYNVSYSTLVEDLKKKLPVDDPTKFTITTLESGLYENELTSASMFQVYGFQRVAYNAVVDGTQYELHEWVKRYEDSTAEIHIGANPLMYGNSFTGVTKCAGFTIWSNDDYLLLKTDSNVKDGGTGNFPKRAGYVYEFPSMQPQTGITIAENGELADKTHYPNNTCMSFYTFDNKLTTGIYTKDSKTNVVGHWDVKSFGIVIPPHTIICSAPEYMSNNGHHGYRQLADDTNITYVDGTSIKTLTNVAIPEDNLAEYYLSIYKVPEIAFDSLYGFWYMR